MLEKQMQKMLWQRVAAGTRLSSATLQGPNLELRPSQDGDSMSVYVISWPLGQAASQFGHLERFPTRNLLRWRLAPKLTTTGKEAVVALVPEAGLLRGKSTSGQGPGTACSATAWPEEHPSPAVPWDGHSCYWPISRLVARLEKASPGRGDAIEP